MRRILVTLILALAIPAPVRGSEQDAVAISSNIQQRHLPHGTILDPVFAAPASDQIVSYTRGGDSALWTGHYLAAEAFRYRVTAAPEALENVRKAVAGIRALTDVTGINLLARCLIPVDSPYAQAVTEEEKRHGTYKNSLGGQQYFWIGNTSRDQYSGVFFGLGVAYDLVDDAELRPAISDLLTRLLDHLIGNNWLVVLPDGSSSTTFAGHPEQRLSFLAVGSHVNPGRFSSTYSAQRFLNYATVGAAVAIEVLDDHSSYFKFNLDTINLYNLIRLEGDDFYRARYLNTYDVLRRTTDGHGNAHFNMIDRALKGPDERRDAETRALLAEWLRRPRRDEWLDWRGNARFPACGDDKACNPIPVIDRVRTDFLWQRSPFLLFGGGYGTIETAGIDYILPYWMARYYGVIQSGDDAPVRRPGAQSRRTSSRPVRQSP
ncbi:MAG TPA: hypothetical protein VFD58_02895 [Blastocatellia bacterium]|nr:hypothetical protein [Blastocatellia bacterium]